MSRPTAAQQELDEKHIARCLELALAYKGFTSPNPVVGCVIVDKKGEVIAEGVHKKAGGPHAEVDALAKLSGARAPGATLYVNLEPCNHHGRTPPCAPAVAASGVARVVIGGEDPIPGHGGGLEALRRRGVKVSTGVLREACVRANRGFYQAAQGRPAYTLKAAMTLDGKIATVSGQSKWITGEYARADVHRLRQEHDAVLIGAETALRDDPWLTCRLVNGRHPVKIVLDGELRTPVDARLLPKKTSPARAILLCGKKAPAAREKALVKQGAEVWRCRTHANGRIDLMSVGPDLVRAGIQSVLVEGGGEVHAYMMQHRLADDLVLYIAPKAVGGPAKSWLGGKGLAHLPSAYRFAFVGDPVVLPGGDLRLVGEPLPPVTAPAPTWEDMLAIDPP
ncbi:MAG: bifunctional diaminohydroxyphosphoribosylaminopyrimidine deaminase/5-amino-6-(5-phosphoribosylamino)uracil reductase RibD [Deltaproteobacteria bacterium]|nr:bifunctional diaminohydroxyphosphoribosylaminopyrimidine deaminase/5-amino-6-(5-phosphoribosylamino)uracil reductase RibD [Deltaproteobacteria bacterium]